jgi:hypothetical protein
MKATDYNQLEKYADVQYEDWQIFFAVWPRTTTGQSRVWGRCYRRRVWAYQGLELWPQGWQYATVFDIVRQHD